MSDLDEALAFGLLVLLVVAVNLLFLIGLETYWDNRKGLRPQSRMAASAAPETLLEPVSEKTIGHPANLAAPSATPAGTVQNPNPPAPPMPASLDPAELRHANAEVERQAGIIKAMQAEAERMKAHALEQAGTISRLMGDVKRLERLLGEAEGRSLQQAVTIKRMEGELKHLEGLVGVTQAAGVGNHTAGQDTRLRALRALIVKELHPDHAPPGSIDRALRTEAFKALWPKVEAITGRAT